MLTASKPRTARVWYTLAMPQAASLQLTVWRTKAGDPKRATCDRVTRARWDDLRGWVALQMLTRAQAAHLMREYRAARAWCPSAICERTR